MTVYEFYQIVGAVIAGNGLCFMFGYYLWQGRQYEKRGEKVERMPLHVHLCGAIPPLVMVLGMFWLV